MRRAVPSLALTLLVLAPAAQAAPPGALAPLAASGLRAVLALAAVLALLAVLAQLLRRLPGPLRGGALADELRSLARLDLGGRREIRLVRVRGHLLVVGVTPERVELLTEIPEQAAPPRSGEMPPLELIRESTTSP